MSLLVDISSIPDRPASESLCASRNCSIASPLSQEDDDPTGIVDPSLDDLLVTDEVNQSDVDDLVPSDIPIGMLADPLDLESKDQDSLGPDLSESYSLESDSHGTLDDDDQGPSGQVYWGELDTGTIAEPDDPGEGPLEARSPALEPLHPLNAEDVDGEESVSTGIPGLEIDDAELPWAKERWAELPLYATFSPRQGLSLVGTTLCAAGDATHLLHARQFDAIEDSPLQVKVRRIMCLDGDANRLLLLTATGQLFLWRRDKGAGSRATKISVPGGEVVSMVWQQSPGAPNLLMRLDSGRLVEWIDSEEEVAPAQPHSAKHRMRAMSEIGEPRVALWQCNREAHLSVEYGAIKQLVSLPPMMERAISDSNPILAGFMDFVLLGVRDHGLFLRGPNNPELTLVPGCRRITAMAIGQIQLRPTAFVGLFSELDDRAEVIALDLATARAGRILELRIHADDAGPADDPPERARIDALLWDPSTLQLWVAGCFGLSCFAPAGATKSS